MEKRCSNIIHVTMECEQTFTLFVIPNFDFVVVTTRDEQGLVLVKVYTTYRPLMFFKFIDKSAGSVVPQLNSTGMKA